MSQSFHLFQLQKIDAQLDSIQARLNQIMEIISSDQSVQLARERLQDVKQKHRNAKHQLTEHESLVEARRIKIEQSESSLYSGSINNPKELQDLQLEITSLKKNLALMEDDLLEAMIFLEEVDNELSSCEQAMAYTTADSLMRNSALNGEKDQLIKTRERLQFERVATVNQISNENLSIYGNLRQSKKGAVVVPVEDGACTGCGSTLTPAEWQASRSPSKIVFCSSCGRILYSA